MLKKLAKYGNSTTLVIDKAILELLNMDESTVVKLRTDGKSLIITPVESNNEGKKISYDNFEAMNAAKESLIKKMPKGSDKIDTEKVQKEFAQVFQRHNAALVKFNHEIINSKDFQDALALLAEKIDPVAQSEEYVKELSLLKVQFCPELADFQKEINEVHKNYASIL